MIHDICPQSALKHSSHQVLITAHRRHPRPQDIDDLARAPGGCAQPLRPHCFFSAGFVGQLLLLKVCPALLKKSFSSAPVTHNISAWRMRRMFGPGEHPFLANGTPLASGNVVICCGSGTTSYGTQERRLLDQLLHLSCAGTELALGCTSYNVHGVFC